MGREFELKFCANDSIHQLIREAYDGWKRIEMETTYYDTPNGDLSARRVTLRRRLENGVSVCTVKTPVDDIGRGEWECECSDILDAIDTLCKLGAPEELKQWVTPGLVRRCGARFTRLCREVRGAGSAMELALDAGVLLGGSKEIPLCEVELEHKDGSEAETLAFAAAFATQYGLIRERKSKFQRASELAEEQGRE